MTVLDLPAYLARTGATVEPPSLEALGRLQRAHVLTFPFDNIDVLLGEHPGRGAGPRVRRGAATGARR